MQEIFNFLLQYWKPIVGVILVLVSFLLTLVRKKPINVVNGFDEDLARWVRNAINAVEALSGLSSQEKLNRAVDMVLEKIGTYYPKCLENSYLRTVIEIEIEETLKTPQATKYKKEVK